MQEHLNDLRAGGRPMTREELAQENKQLKNNWNELKKWVKQIQDYHIEQRGLVDNEFNYCLESEDIDVLEDVLHKMQELER